jgi:hypothetical protein
MRRILIPNKYTCVARKGQFKFYHIHEIDLQKDEQYFAAYNADNAATDEEYDEILKNQSLRNYTLAPVYNAFKDGYSVEIVKTTYVEGVHAQISWLENEDTWVIASKHASVFAKTLEDLTCYNGHPKSSHYAPVMIADFWLNIVNDIEDIDSLKSDIAGKTL